jgi:hypothetical protein
MVICPSIGARNHANKWYFRVPKQALDLPFFFFPFLQKLKQSFSFQGNWRRKGCIESTKGHSKTHNIG